MEIACVCQKTNAWKNILEVDDIKTDWLIQQHSIETKRWIFDICRNMDESEDIMLSKKI